MIQFLLHETLVTEHDLDPSMTVSRYLRQRLRRTGTKEGCGAGDCGACTVAIGRVEQGRMQYETANACLMLVSALHGKQLITVEDLRQDGALHPVQQAVVDLHASQCGFCTPGVVMSLFVLQKQVALQKQVVLQKYSQGWDRHRAEQALAGNLCRCTGYRPILDAARQLCEQPAQDSFTRHEPAIIERLNALAATEARLLTNGVRHCFLPNTLEQLADDYLRYPQARLVAGGTDLTLEMASMDQTPPLIALAQVAELQNGQIGTDTIQLGAGMTLTQCETLLRDTLPAFVQALQRFASRQIRNRGTLGGNIANASPVGDTPPMLLALDAELLLQRGATLRRLALHDFFLSYRKTALMKSEFIRAIVIPRGALLAHFQAWKVSKRADDDISIVFGAFAIHIERGYVIQARVAFGGMDAIPRRAALCEQTLVNQPWTLATVERACLALEHDFTPLSDARASAEYRMQVAKNLLRRYFSGFQNPAYMTEAAHDLA